MNHSEDLCLFQEPQTKEEIYYQFARLIKFIEAHVWGTYHDYSDFSSRMARLGFAQLDRFVKQYRSNLPEDANDVLDQLHSLRVRV